MFTITAAFKWREKEGSIWEQIKALTNFLCWKPFVLCFQFQMPTRDTKSVSEMSAFRDFFFFWVFWISFLMWRPISVKKNDHFFRLTYEISFISAYLHTKSLIAFRQIQWPDISAYCQWSPGSLKMTLAGYVECWLEGGWLRCRTGCDYRLAGISATDSPILDLLFHCW